MVVVATARTPSRKCMPGFDQKNPNIPIKSKPPYFYKTPKIIVLLLINIKKNINLDKLWKKILYKIENIYFIIPAAE